MPDMKRILITRLLPSDVMARARRGHDVISNDDDHIMGAQEILEKLSEKRGKLSPAFFLQALDRLTSTETMRSC